MPSTWVSAGGTQLYWPHHNSGNLINDAASQPVDTSTWIKLECTIKRHSIATLQEALDAVDEMSVSTAPTNTKRLKRPANISNSVDNTKNNIISMVLAQVESSMSTAMIEMQERMTRTLASIKSDFRIFEAEPMIDEEQEEQGTFQFTAVRTAEELQQLENNLENPEYQREVVSNDERLHCLPSIFFYFHF